MLSEIDKAIARERIKDLSANIAGQFGGPEINIKKWLDQLFPVLLLFQSQYGCKDYAFMIAESPLPLDESQSLSIDALWEFMSRGFECFRIDLNTRFGLLTPVFSRAELLNISAYCYDNNVPALYIVGGEEVWLYNKEGRAIAFYNFAHPEVTTGRRFGRNSRSYKDYKRVIEEQEKKQLINKIDEIWDDRRNRILISNRKTEKMLQTFYWVCT